MNPVPAGLRSHIQNRIADAACPPLHDLISLSDSEAEDIDEIITVINLMEINLSSDSGHTHTVSITGDAGDHPFEEIAVARES